MRKLNVTILEKEQEYARRLALAIVRLEQGKIDAAWYSSPELYLEDGGERREDILLVGDSFHEEQLFTALRKKSGGMLVLLAGDGVDRKWRDYPVIRKYSSVEEIIRNIYGYLAEYACEDAVFAGRGKQIVGVYAPWHQELSVLFSCVLLQILAEKENFLYVSLLEGMIEAADHAWQEENLADFISFLRMEKGSATARLKSICRSLGKGSYLPPADNPQNIFDLSESDYRRLWDVLLEQAEYEGLLMEFGVAYPAVYEDMKRCQVIYCPYQEEYMMENRREKLAQVFQLHGAGELSDCIREVRLPRPAFCGNGGIRTREALAQELLCSEFGDAVRGLVNGYEG